MRVIFYVSVLALSLTCFASGDIFAQNTVNDEGVNVERTFKQERSVRVSVSLVPEKKVPHARAVGLGEYIARWITEIRSPSSMYMRSIVPAHWKGEMRGAELISSVYKSTIWGHRPSLGEIARWASAEGYVLSRVQYFNN